MIQQRPLGVKLISIFYLWGAGVLIFGLFFLDMSGETFGIATRHGLPSTLEVPARILIAILAICLSYGLFQLRRWGFWFAIIYSIYFLFISSVLYTETKNDLFTGNAIWAAIVLVYILVKRRVFTN